MKEKISCIVTSAESSVGQAIIDALRDRGSTVVALFDGEPTQLIESAPDYYTITNNLSDKANVVSVINSIQQNIGQVENWVNLIGEETQTQSFDESAMGDWNEILTVNFTKTLNSCQSILPIMREQGFGVIINVGCYPHEEGEELSPPYSISKETVLSLSKSIVDDNSEYDISAHSLFPSTIDTPKNRKAMADADWSKWLKPSAIADEIADLLGESEPEETPNMKEEHPLSEEETSDETIEEENISPTGSTEETEDEDSPEKPKNTDILPSEEEISNAKPISPKLASFTLIKVLKKQKLYKKALDVLNVLEKTEGSDPEKILQERREIMAAMAARGESGKLEQLPGEELVAEALGETDIEPKPNDEDESEIETQEESSIEDLLKPEENESDISQEVPSDSKKVSFTMETHFKTEGGDGDNLETYEILEKKKIIIQRISQRQKNLLLTVRNN